MKNELIELLIKNIEIYDLSGYNPSATWNYKDIISSILATYNYERNTKFVTDKAYELLNKYYKLKIKEEIYIHEWLGLETTNDFDRLTIKLNNNFHLSCYAENGNLVSYTLYFQWYTYVPDNSIISMKNCIPVFPETDDEVFEFYDMIEKRKEGV